MKLILSRKGFDSQYGGIPSPILPDGRLVPLPIPSRHDQHTFTDLGVEGIDIGALLHDLSNAKIDVSNTVHLDPWLTCIESQRTPGWRPSLGQTGSAQAHLSSRGVGVGDVFLFFGWFRQVEILAGKFRYSQRSPNLHVIFGWLEVDEVLPIVAERAKWLGSHPWIAAHPHVSLPEHYTDPRNTLYVASRASRFEGQVEFGGGRFQGFDPRLQLTAHARTRSFWSLPKWFMPSHTKDPMSYHSDPSRWNPNGDSVILRSAAKGQEFVIDGSQYPDVESWVGDIIRAGCCP
jgi:hypothetical protein